MCEMVKPSKCPTQKNDNFTNQLRLQQVTNTIDIFERMFPDA